MQSSHHPLFVWAPDMHLPSELKTSLSACLSHQDAELGERQQMATVNTSHNGTFHSRSQSTWQNPTHHCAFSLPSEASEQAVSSVRCVVVSKTQDG